MSSIKRKEESARRTIIDAHVGLAKVYKYRIFQSLRPELCVRLQCSSDKLELEFFIQLLGYYHNSLPGIVVYNTFDDFCSMIYKQQTIDNLAALKKAYYTVFLAKNHKNSTTSSKQHSSTESECKSSLSPLSISPTTHKPSNSQHSPYSCPHSRVSASHWHMIKGYNACAHSALNPKLPIIPCFTPRLDKLHNPQLRLQTWIWITHALTSYFHSNNRQNPYKTTYKNHNLTLTIGYKTSSLSLPKLPLRPWLKTLPYIFNTMQTCGDGLTYFKKKLSEAENKLILRKVAADGYFLDPAGIDYVTALKGLVGVHMKLAILDTKIYETCLDSFLSKALAKDSRDTLKCRALKLKCLLFMGRFEEYRCELMGDKCYDEKKVHRIDAALSWNVSLCLFKLFGREDERVVSSVKRSVQNHASVLYVLIGMKSGDCKHARNRREIERCVSWFEEYGAFWMSDADVCLFVMRDVLFYYLDCKCRPLHLFMLSKNRSFLASCKGRVDSDGSGKGQEKRSGLQPRVMQVLDWLGLEDGPKCMNGSCKRDGRVLCLVCRVCCWCSEECREESVRLKKHVVECEMVKRVKRVYVYWKENVIGSVEGNGVDVRLNGDSKEEEEEDDDEVAWRDDDVDDGQEEESIETFMHKLQENNLVNLPTPKAVNVDEKNGARKKERKKRKSIEGKQGAVEGFAGKRRGSVDLDGD